MEKSKKGKLNTRDLLRGGLFASAGAFLSVVGVLSSGAVPSFADVRASILSFVGTFLLYLIKNLPEGEK